MFFSFWQQNSLSRPLTVTPCTHLSLGLGWHITTCLSEPAAAGSRGRVTQAPASPITLVPRRPPLPPRPPPGPPATAGYLQVTWRLQNEVARTNYVIIRAYYAWPGADTEHKFSPWRSWGCNAGGETTWGWGQLVAGGGDGSHSSEPASHNPLLPSPLPIFEAVSAQRRAIAGGGWQHDRRGRTDSPSIGTG